MRTWMIRGLLLAAMARDAVPQLTSPEDVSVHEFMQCNPDSKSWVKRLRIKGRCASARIFFESIGYSGPPELRSMFLCLLRTKVMRKSRAWYEEHGRALRADMLGHEASHGLMKVPALCVSEVCVSQRR